MVVLLIILPIFKGPSSEMYHNIICTITNQKLCKLTLQIYILSHATSIGSSRKLWRVRIFSWDTMADRKINLNSLGPSALLGISSP